MPVILIATGAILVVLTFLLAFTLFGLISAFLAVVCIASGAVMLNTRASGPKTG
jgi:hypothetical protein